MKKEKEFRAFTQNETITIPAALTTSSVKRFHCPACPFFDKLSLTCAWHPKTVFGDAVHNPKKA